MKKNFMNGISNANKILLGLLMLVPGLTKLFVLGPDRVVGMLTGLGFPAPALFAWILILSEIIFGLAILARWKLEYTIIPAVIVLIVSAFTAHLDDPLRIIMHFILITEYFLLAYSKK